MTMKTFRDQQRAERLAHVEQLIAQAGSVRGAAKLAGMRRQHVIRLRPALSPKGDILTPAAPPRTN